MNEFISILVSHGDTIIVVVIAIVLGWDKYISGSGTLRKEIAADYKERNLQLEARLQENSDEIQKTNLEVARLSGVIQEKDKHIESLTKVLQGRNPELMEVLKEIKDGNAAIQNFIKTSYELLKKSSEELGYQTELLEQGKMRNVKIDKASKQHIGSLIRVPDGKKKSKAK